MNESKFPINLESLIELSARLNETHNYGFILNAALLSLMGKLTISNGCVLVSEAENADFIMIVSKGHYSVEKIKYFEIFHFEEISKEDCPYPELFNKGIRFIIPVLYQKKILAIICLGKRLLESKFSDNELLYINLVASITANALQIANEHQALQKIKNKLEYRNLTLNTLFEISREFSTINSSDKIIKLLSLRLMGQLMVNKFALFIIDSAGVIEPVINRCDKEIRHEHFSDLMMLKSIESRNRISSQSLKTLFDETDLEVIVPLILQNEIKGILFVGPRMNKAKYSDENLDFIESLGITAITALENERLFRQELEKKRIENELDLALEIQRGFLPKEFIDNDRFSIHGFTIPSRFVGGDYFDYFQLSDNRLIVVIADVSGKGMAASLIMANLQSALKVLVSLELDIAKIVNRLNNVVFENTATDRFVTFFIAQIDFEANTLQYINAGHNPPLLLSLDDSYIKLEAENVPLGIFDALYRYSSNLLTFKPTDRLVLYTDGITEAQNSKKREFGEENLITLLIKNKNLEPRALSDFISDSVVKFAASAQQYDDITCLCVKIK